MLYCHQSPRSMQNLACMLVTPVSRICEKLIEDLEQESEWQAGEMLKVLKFEFNYFYIDIVNRQP